MKCGWVLLLFIIIYVRAQLNTAFDSRGLTVLSYNGVTLLNLNGGVGDQFYVGTYKYAGQYGWGGLGNTASWNSGTNTLTWTWPWGSISCQYVTGTSSLEVTCRVVNSGSQSLDAIDIYPFGVLFPTVPTEFGSPSTPQFHNNLDGPSPIPATWNNGMLVLSNHDAQPMYLGFEPTGPNGHYLIRMGTHTDGSISFLGSSVPVNRPISAGSSATFGFSMRFAAAGSNYLTMTSDVLATYRSAWPMQLNWPDRRPIGQLFITNPTSSPTSGSSPNPRGYTFAQGINIQTSQGLAAFQTAALAYMDNAVSVLLNMGAQGVIVWDLEGQQYPQPDTSYVGDPTLLPQMAPEMDSIANQFFAKLTNAGLKCGLTIRPQILNLNVTPPHQDEARGQEDVLMIRKMQYARQRWGCTIFYVDSDGGPFDSTPPVKFQNVLTALPNVLVIPENVWAKDYAYSAPLATYLATYKPIHTPANVIATYPGAFSVTYVGDAPNNDLTPQWAEYVAAVRRGDILSFRAWYNDQPLNGQVKQIYQQAGVSLTPTPTPAPTPKPTTPPTPKPTTKPTPAPNGYLGCYIDSNTRDVSYHLVDSNAVTIEKCQYSCGLRNFKYAALQNANQCWCGNSYGSQGMVADSECNKACTGNANEKCGSGWRNSVYTSLSKSAIGYLGCFVDSANRDLPFSYSTGPATIDQCRTTCYSQGFAYAAVQYSFQCWCGQRYGLQGQVPDSECNMPCSSDAAEMCGAGWRNSVYTSELTNPGF